MRGFLQRVNARSLTGTVVPASDLTRSPICSFLRVKIFNRDADTACTGVRWAIALTVCWCSFVYFKMRIIRSVWNIAAIALLFLPGYAHAYPLHRVPTIWCYLYSFSPLAAVFSLVLASGACLSRRWRLASILALTAALCFLLHWGLSWWEYTDLFWGDYAPIPQGVLS